MREKTYLGDGVYASFDGWQIWLSLDTQDDSLIALEPRIIDKLNEFAKHMYEPEKSESVEETRETE